jgi:hypothetical protein
MWKELFIESGVNSLLRLVRQTNWSQHQPLFDGARISRPQSPVTFSCTGLVAESRTPFQRVLFLRFPGSKLFNRCGFPNSGVAIPTGGGDSVSIRRESYGSNSCAMSSEGEQFVAGCAVPKLGRPIQACRHDALTVWGNRYTPDPVAVASEKAQFFSCLGIPDPRSAIPASRDTT